MNTTFQTSVNTNSRSNINSRRNVELLANYLKHCSDTRNMCLNMFNLLNTQENNMRLALTGVLQPDLLTDVYNNSNMFANNRNLYTQSDRNNNNNHNNDEFDINNLFGIIFREIQRTTTNQSERRRVPTQDEIRNATTETNFGNLTNPINTTCPITGDTFESQTLVLKINHCGHVFEKQSLLSWFVRNSRCPLCRYSILSSNNNTNTNNLRTNENHEINNNNSSRENQSQPNFQIESIIIEPVYETNMTSNNLQTQNNNRNSSNNSSSNISRNTHGSNSSNNSNHINYHTLFESNLNPLQLLQNILASPGVTQTSYQILSNNNNNNQPNTLNFDLSSNLLD